MGAAIMFIMKKVHWGGHAGPDCFIKHKHMFICEKQLSLPQSHTLLAVWTQWARGSLFCASQLRFYSFKSAPAFCLFWLLLYPKSFVNPPPPHRYLKINKFLIKRLFISKSDGLIRGARKLVGENLKPVWAEFSTLS